MHAIRLSILPAAALLAGAMTLIAGCGEKSSPWAPVSPVTFEFSGVMESSCEVISFQVCDDAPFGTGVAPGTPVTGRVTFDSDAPRVTSADTPGFIYVRYFGASVEFSVGTSAVSGNDPKAAYIQIVALPGSHTFEVTVESGFTTGQVAGLPIHYFTLTLPIVPLRFPDVSLPEDAAIFQPGIHGSPGAQIVVKYHTNPAYSMFGLVAPGTILGGSITSLESR